MFRYIKKRANRHGESEGEASTAVSDNNGFANHSGHSSSNGGNSHELSVPGADVTSSSIAAAAAPVPTRNASYEGKKWGKRRPVESLAEQQRKLDESILSKKVHHLAKFDACIEACDALAASSSLVSNGRRHEPFTSIPDCSVLVSPDGDLLLMPQQQLQQQQQQQQQQVNHGHSQFTSPLSELGEEYESAIFVGNDFEGGDLALNGFTASGWSIPAASLALRQTEQSLHDFADFCEEVILSKKDASSRQSVACDKLRALSYERGPTMPKDLQEDVELMKAATNQPFELTQHRVGPILFNGGSLHTAHVALEEYYQQMAERESERWRLASLQRRGSLPPLRKAATRAEERSANRQKTLREIYKRVQKVEDHLAACKLEAQRKWKEVELVEDKVTKMVTERMKELNRKMEDERLKEFQKTAGEQDAAGTNTATNTADILDLVSQVTASMEMGSFEPIEFSPSAATTTGSLQSNDEEKKTSPSVASMRSTTTEPLLDIPPMIATRIDLEDDIGLPELRAAAFAADRLVHDASGSLLNVLSSLDQIRRSARIASETNLLSACNAQADCIRSIVRLERAAVEDRLKFLVDLEKKCDDIDIRRDLYTYINEDRKRPGGGAPAGQDDDGGIASALAVLTSHVEGDMSTDTPITFSGSAAADDGGNESIAKSTTPEALEEALEKLFSQNCHLEPDASPSPERDHAREVFHEAVRLLCDVAIEKSNAARPRRSRMCYALNAKRGSHAEINCPIQFDALCKVFSAILSGCDCESGGVSNAKMCIMLSQTFYFSEKAKGSVDRDERSKRVYVKNRLIGHPLWLEEEFWYVLSILKQ